MKPSNVEVSTRAFEAAHAKSPRGTGSWGFCPRAKYDREDYLSHVFWVSGAYGVSKRAAQQHFAALNVEYVVVCS